MKVNKHNWQPTDTEGHSMECISCGKNIHFGEKEWDSVINGGCVSNEYDTHFEIIVPIKTEIKCEEELKDILDELFPDEVIYTFEEIMHTGIDFDRDEIELINMGDNIKSEFKLTWTGFWMVTSIDKNEATSTANEIMSRLITMFKERLVDVFNRDSRFEVIFPEQYKVTDILEH